MPAFIKSSKFSLFVRSEELKRKKTLFISAAIVIQVNVLYYVRIFSIDYIFFRTAPKNMWKNLPNDKGERRSEYWIPGAFGFFDFDFNNVFSPRV